MLRPSPWRIEARSTIERVARENFSQSETEIRCAIRAAYPFGERKYWPYDIWRQEVERFFGRRQEKANCQVSEKYLTGSLFSEIDEN